MDITRLVKKHRQNNDFLTVFWRYETLRHIP